MMPKLYRATVDILIEAESPFRAMDAVAEMLLPLSEDGSLLDWQYTPDLEIDEEQRVQKVRRYLKPAEISPDVAEHHFDDFTPK